MDLLVQIVVSLLKNLGHNIAAAFKEQRGERSLRRKRKKLPGLLSFVSQSTRADKYVWYGAPLPRENIIAAT